MTEVELVQGIVQIIDEPTVVHYQRIFGIAKTDALSGGQTRELSRGLLNSFVVALPTAIISTAIAMLAGYAFGRFIFPGQRSLLFTLLLTRVPPGRPPFLLSPLRQGSRLAFGKARYVATTTASGASPSAAKAGAEMHYDRDGLSARELWCGRPGLFCFMERGPSAAIGVLAARRQHSGRNRCPKPGGITCCGDGDGGG